MNQLITKNIFAGKYITDRNLGKILKSPDIYLNICTISLAHPSFTLEVSVSRTEPVVVIVVIVGNYLCGHPTKNMLELYFGAASTRQIRSIFKIKHHMWTLVQATC